MGDAKRKGTYDRLFASLDKSTIVDGPVTINTISPEALRRATSPPIPHLALTALSAHPRLMLVLLLGLLDPHPACIRRPESPVDLASRLVAPQTPRLGVSMPVPPISPSAAASAEADETPSHALDLRSAHRDWDTIDADAQTQSEPDRGVGSSSSRCGSAVRVRLAVLELILEHASHIAR